jgi:hypothetical protein
MRRPSAAGRFVARVVALAVAAAWIVACSSPQPSALQAVTGVRLKSALLPASEFHAGFTIDAKYSYNSGSRLSSSPARYGLATMTCNTLALQLGEPGFGETAMAVDQLDDQDTEQAYGQFVYQFRHPATASAFIAELRITAMRCRSFTVRDFGNSDHTQQTTAAMLVNGHRAVQIAEVAVDAANTSDFDYLFVLDGTDVCGSSRAGFGGALVPDQPTLATIVARLITRVQALK